MRNPTSACSFNYLQLYFSHSYSSYHNTHALVLSSLSRHKPKQILAHAFPFKTSHVPRPSPTSLASPNYCICTDHCTLHQHNISTRTPSAFSGKPSQPSNLPNPNGLEALPLAQSYERSRSKNNISATSRSQKFALNIRTHPESPIAYPCPQELNLTVDPAARNRRNLHRGVR